MRQDRDPADEFDDAWEDDSYDDDASDTLPCPHCRREIYEEAERCPHRGHYVSDADSPVAPKPWLIAVGVVLCLIAVYFWVFGPR
jgi:hypothetical protein